MQPLCCTEASGQVRVVVIVVQLSLCTPLATLILWSIVESCWLLQLLEAASFWYSRKFSRQRAVAVLLGM